MPVRFMPSRRRWLKATLGLAAVAAAGFGAAALEGPQLFNPCLPALPAALAEDPLVRAAWQGLDPAQVWDCHVHLAGLGDGPSGIEVSPRMDSLWHPVEYVQRRFYMNAACADQAPGPVDQRYVARLQDLVGGLPPGARLMLFAFERAYDTSGRALPERTAFHVPDAWARRVARAAPQRFEWVCSVHPYREDAVDALQQAAAQGARAVKWLPPAMGIDPASPACDRFYDALARLDLPLISHAGEEQAVQGAGAAGWGNPLRLRRALARGVRVVLAHCASIGEDVDLDRGPGGPRVPSFELFARMMDEPEWQGLLFADISAVVLRNRETEVLRRILTTSEWHPRLLNGSDYPLPGIVPLVALGRLAADGLLAEAAVPSLAALREHNPLLFDFVLKRHLGGAGARLPPAVFETRRFFERALA